MANPNPNCPDCQRPMRSTSNSYFTCVYCSRVYHMPTHWNTAKFNYSDYNSAFGYNTLTHAVIPNCPDCGRPFQFQSTNSSHYQCRWCSREYTIPSHWFTKWFNYSDFISMYSIVGVA